jgi:hypothetical protein
MKARVLIFDEDQTVRELIWTVCNIRGYEVFLFNEPVYCPFKSNELCCCETGLACTDMIIADLSKPSRTALSFIAALVSKDCHCRNIALMSGAWSEYDAARAKGLGCQLIQKPSILGQISTWFEKVERSLDPCRQLPAWR